MIAIITVLLGIFIYLFSGITFAQYGETLCKNDSEFTCHKVKRGESWKSLFPLEDRRDLAMRANRMNTHLYPGLIIAIPSSNHLTLMDISPFNTQIDPPGEKVIFVSINKLAWGAYDSSGTLVNWGPISSARGYCSDLGSRCRTSLGEYEIYRKEGADCKSSKFPIGRGGAPMPYCMFYNGGFALHGSYTVPGYNDSHGCVRLFVNDAKWLNQEFVADENIRVIIKQF